MKNLQIRNEFIIDEMIELTKEYNVLTNQQQPSSDYYNLMCDKHGNNPRNKEVRNALTNCHDIARQKESVLKKIGSLFLLYKKEESPTLI